MSPNQTHAQQEQKRCKYRVSTNEYSTVKQIRTDQRHITMQSARTRSLNA